MKGKLKKMVTLDAPPGSTGERITKRLEQAQGEGHGKPMEHIRQWLQAGYLLAEFGHGIVDAWLALDREGHTRDLSQKQKAEYLVQLIERTQWSNAMPVNDSQPVPGQPRNTPGNTKVDTTKLRSPATKQKLGRHLA